MKKLFSIAFIVILLLNVMGYYLVFLGLQYQNDATMIKVLDANQYDQLQTFTLKVPISIPYISNRTDFDRVDGKFEYQGEHYRMVKQKFDKDTLTVVCVHDKKTKRITEALSSYLTTFTDQSSPDGHPSKVTLSFIKDYLPQYFSINTTSNGWQATVNHYSGCRQLTSSYISTLSHPPERG